MRFTQFYLPPQEYISDNKRMRIRVGSYIETVSFERSERNYIFAQKITQNLGIELPHYPVGGAFNFKQFSKEAEITDLLDALSEIFNCLDWLEKTRFKDFINSCFKEQGLAYFMNEQGEIRFWPDDEFEKNRLLALKNLTNPDFEPVIAAYNTAFNEFQTDINKSKSALRHIFEANEILFKKLTKNQYNFDQLNTSNLEKAKNILLPDSQFSDKTAKQTSHKFFESYKKWVEAMQPYRHGQDTEKYDTPPIDLTILALSNGAAFLRWLASMVKNS